MITFPGLVLGERYALGERLAIGGMGEVWSGRDTVLDRPVAVKVLRTDLGNPGPLLARFRAEARTAAMISHPGIASMFDVREEDGVAYLVMELVPGEPLSAVIARDGALGTRRTLDLVAQTGRALHAAHLRGVVHRDVKPANLMITPDGVVKVTDFGIARPRDHEPLTATGQVMGTAHYLAPEVARGQTATAASDVYALGIVAYECLAGYRPFDGVNQVAVATAHLHETAPPLPETLSPAVRDLVGRAMAKDPRERPPSALALAQEAERLAAGGPGRPTRPTAPPSTPPTPPPSPPASAPAADEPPPIDRTAVLPVIREEIAEEPTPAADDGAAGPDVTSGTPADDGRDGREGTAGRSAEPASRARAAVEGRRAGRFRSPLVALLALVVLVVVGAALSSGGRTSGAGGPDGTAPCARPVGSDGRTAPGPARSGVVVDGCKGWIR